MYVCNKSMYDSKYYKRYRRYIRYDNLSDILTYKKIMLLFDGFNNADYILDSGCGVGYVANWLNNYSDQIFGIDISSESLSFSKGMYPRVHFSGADSCKLPFKDCSFDKIIINNVIEHLSEQNNLLIETKRVMKKNGKIILITADKDSIFKKVLIQDKTHIKELNEVQMYNLMTDHFSNVKLDRGLSTVKGPAILRRIISYLIKIDIIAYGEKIK